MKSMAYPFTEEQLEAANTEWGCNCGPSALAFALQKPLDAVRHAIPGFEQKQYTSPTMMRQGLAFFHQGYREVRPATFSTGKPVDIDPMFQDAPSLVRVQWTGPWTKPGTNPKWAYWYTHWIATWRERGVCLTFDCNSGILGASAWCDGTVPLIIQHTPRADGEWFPTHIWTLTQPLTGVSHG